MGEGARQARCVVVAAPAGAVGYVREGQYYSGSPVVQPTNVAYTGERG